MAVVVCIVLLVGLLQYSAEQLMIQMAGIRGEGVERRGLQLQHLFQRMFETISIAMVPIVLATATLIAWRIYRERTRLLGIIKAPSFNGHLLFFGPTGSGKTSTALRAIELSLREGIDVVVIDWKGEYVKKIRGATVVRRFNILEPAGPITLHSMVVTDILRDILELSEPMVSVLYEELSRMYENKLASFSDLLRLIKERREEMIHAKNIAEARIAEGLIRRLLPLVLDEKREAVNVKGADNVVIYDLSKIPTYQLRSLYAEVILWRLYNEAKEVADNRLRKLIVAEESQNYVRPRRFDQQSIGERIINEIRVYGYGCLLISPDPYQLPLHISRDVAAIISIGYQGLPDVVLGILSLYRYYDAKKLAKIAGKPRTYIYHNGRLYIKGLPRPFTKTIELEAEVREEVVKAEEETKSVVVDLKMLAKYPFLKEASKVASAFTFEELDKDIYIHG